MHSTFLSAKMRVVCTILAALWLAVVTGRADENSPTRCCPSRFYVNTDLKDLWVLLVCIFLQSSSLWTLRNSGPLPCQMWRKGGGQISVRCSIFGIHRKSVEWATFAAERTSNMSFILNDVWMSQLKRNWWQEKKGQLLLSYEIHTAKLIENVCKGYKTVTLRLSRSTTSKLTLHCIWNWFQLCTAIMLCFPGHHTVDVARFLYIQLIHFHDINSQYTHSYLSLHNYTFSCTLLTCT